LTLRREIHFAGFFGEGVKLFALERHLAEGDEGSAHVLGHLDKIFPGVGVVIAFPYDGRNVLGYVAGEAVHTMTFNEGHHVVFEGE